MKDSFAVVAVGGTQFIVSENDVVTVNRLKNKKGETFSLDSVLLRKDGDSIEIGAPTVRATVTAEVMEHFRGPKMDIRRYTAKSRKRRTVGHRQECTRVRILSISDDKKKAVVPAKTKTSRPLSRVATTRRSSAVKRVVKAKKS